jgi:hypothetical protein
MASLRRRLDRLEAAVPGRQVGFVVLDHWPDGGTRAFLDDGTELPPGADWRALVVGWTTVMRGVSLDVIVGRAPGIPLVADPNEMVIGI